MCPPADAVKVGPFVPPRLNISSGPSLKVATPRVGVGAGGRGGVGWGRGGVGWGRDRLAPSCSHVFKGKLNKSSLLMPFGHTISKKRLDWSEGGGGGGGVGQVVRWAGAVTSAVSSSE